MFYDDISGWLSCSRKSVNFDAIIRRWVISAEGGIEKIEQGMVMKDLKKLKQRWISRKMSDCHGFPTLLISFLRGGGLNNHDFSALSFLKVRQLMKAFHLSQQWDAKLIRCCMLIFFSLLCFVSAFLSWEGMIWRWKENCFAFLSHIVFFIKAAMIFCFLYFFAPKCFRRKYFDQWEAGHFYDNKNTWRSLVGT